MTPRAKNSCSSAVNKYVTAPCTEPPIKFCLTGAPRTRKNNLATSSTAIAKRQIVAVCFIFEIIFSSDVISGVAVIIFAGVDIFIPLTYHKMIIFGAAWYSYGECARKLGIAALIMAVLIIAGLILQRKREYYEYKKEDE